MSADRRLVAGLAALLAAGCAPPPPPPAPAPLPPLPPEALAPPPAPPGRAPRTPAVPDPLADFPPGRPVTLSASAVDVRTLLPALAEAAGLSLVLGPDIQGRLSLNLVEVPAMEALRLVLLEAGLFVAAGPPEAPYGPVIYYVLPVDIETASAELIQARFGVSAEMARWIVESRVR